MTKDFKLSLSVAPDLAPFALSKQEKEMTPEDWAWHFLRLNQDYRDAYSAALEKQTANPQSRTGMSRFRREYLHRTIYVDEQECRDRFGLSTWLDPKNHSLPELGDGQSWFAPLRAVCVRYSPDLKAIDFSACDDLFGLLKQPARRGIKIDLHDGNGSRRKPSLSAAIDFIVDVSVPLNGQMASVIWLTQRYKEMFRQSGLSPSDFDKEIIKPWMVVGEFESPSGEKRDPLFANKPARQPQRAPGSTTEAGNEDKLLIVNSVKDPDIHINLARSVGKQLSGYDSLVAYKRRWLIDQDLIEKPPHERLWLRLGTTRGRGAGTPMDGHTLKAYVIISECHREGATTPDDVFSMLESNGAKKRDSFARLSFEWSEYTKTRANRFKEYAESAKAYIEEDYKWLVHAQKP